MKNETPAGQVLPPEAVIDMVSGSYPPDVCGVGDYSQQLLQHLLRLHACQGEAFRPSRQLLRRWWRGWPSRGRVAIFQYPTAAYGASLLPHLFVMLARVLGLRVIVVLHEYSSLGRKARLAASLFGMFAHRLVFTTDYESRCYPLMRAKHAVIPIGSNIPRAAPPAANRDDDCVYFGIIAPGKGIESFLSAAAALGGRRFVLLGAPSPLFVAYGQEVVARAQALGCTVRLGLPAGEVAAVLSGCKVALLPFPDGISPRRGSALAAMLNGALVVTCPPPPHYAFMADFCVCLDLAQAVPVQLARVLDSIDTYRDTLARAAGFAAAAAWPEVCARFIELSGLSGENTGK